MARYFFDLLNGDGFVEDCDGRDLPDIAAVHREVAAIAVDLATDEIKGVDPFLARVTVRDDQGSVVLTATMSFQVE